MLTYTDCMTNAHLKFATKIDPRLAAESAAARAKLVKGAEEVEDGKKSLEVFMAEYRAAYAKVDAVLSTLVAEAKAQESYADELRAKTSASLIATGLAIATPAAPTTINCSRFMNTVTCR